MSDDINDEFPATLNATDRSREAAMKTLEVLSGPADVQDVDPNAWLANPDENMLGEVVVEGKRLKIAALTEAETQSLLKRCRRPNPRNPTAEPQLDSMLFRLEMIALSLNKGNPTGTPIMASQLQGRKTGILTTIQDAVMLLSGMDVAGRTGGPSASFFG